MSLPWPNLTTEEWQHRLHMPVASRTAASRKETAVHAAADKHVNKLSALFANALARARRTKTADAAVAALKSALKDSLETALLNIATAGGNAAVTMLRTAGGPGSGDFGHAGRPGEVGGSSDSGGHTDPNDPDNSRYTPYSFEAYHGTREAALESIAQKGLIPRGGPGADAANTFIGELWDVGDRKTSVFVSNDIGIADDFAHLVSKNAPESKPVILRVEIPDEALKNVVIDEAARPPALAAIMEPDMFRFKGAIPPAWISVVETEHKGPGRHGTENTPSTPILEHVKKTKQLAAAGRVFYVVFFVNEMRAAGGAGSGNFGHEGRPGEVGGSGGGNAKETRVGKQIVEKIRESGTASDYVHELYSDDPLDAIATNFKFNTVRDADIEYAREQLKQSSQQMLRDKFGDTVTAYRGITGREKQATISLTLDAGVAKRATPQAYKTWGKEFGDVKEFQVPVSDVLSYSEAIGKGTYAEEEIVVHRATLRGLMRAAAKATVKMQFNAKNPAVIQWAKDHAAELVTQISETTREDIRDAIVRAQETGEDPRDAIEAAIGDETRADLIARTETLMAAHEGQRQAWDQAIEHGLLTGDERRVWIATADDVTCPICEELDGEIADLDGEYAGGYDGPPAHPNCRCTEGLTG